MRRILLVLSAALLAATLTATAGHGAKGPLTFQVRIIQEATVRHPHPPAGDAGDTFSTTLRLFAIGTVLGYPANTPMGTMAFTWGPLDGSCSSSTAGCSGTTNLETLTRLPGGTIIANGLNVNLAHGLVVPIQKGTGIFKGVTGRIQIAPGLEAEDVYHLVLP